MTLIEEMIADGLITDPASAKGKLLISSAHLFKVKGFASTTVRDIARDVGILSGSIFHHFANKEAILFGVMQEAVIIATAKMNAALEQSQGPRGRLLALISCELEAVHGLSGEGFTLLLDEWRNLCAENQDELLKLRERYERIWLDVLDETRAAGMTRLDSFILRRFLLGALANTKVWFHLDGELTLQELSFQVLRLVCPED